ncbi:hypothetical protein C8F04DRAFT_1234252 [Mycena alexandri]|uniref:Uncharacterized protein n=1 Tax=Mycena alexandri TaxID=1745969 RepID=A0AAD6SV77_9AGAR|nr:hypothetical protein C8F04DRAFT_1234252 [Mycena alexandri]
MLFWILVAGRLSGFTQGHPDLISRDTSCDSISNNCRTLFDIVWGCLATIFACTWVALHQNVPDPKLRMMLITILAPEVIVSFAARQFMSSLWISKKFNVSNTHGFFCTMRGFVSQEGHPIAKVRQLPAYISAIREVQEADIMDRSKGDALSKGFAFMQALWFVTQCLARVVQGLYRIGSRHIGICHSQHLHPVAVVAKTARCAAAPRPGLVRCSDPRESTNVGQLPRTAVSLRRKFVETALHVVGEDFTYHPETSTSVPSFYSMSIDHEIYGFVTAGVVLAAGAIFGGIHCAAWNALFPSASEMWTWRIASVFIAAYPVIVACVGVFIDTLDDRGVGGVAKQTLKVTLDIGIGIYIICRLVLIILVFTTLRALSSADFIDVNWSQYFPHL